MTDRQRLLKPATPTPATLEAMEEARAAGPGFAALVDALVMAERFWGASSLAEDRESIIGYGKDAAAARTALLAEHARVVEREATLRMALTTLLATEPVQHPITMRWMFAVEPETFAAARSALAADAKVEGVNHE